MSTRFFTRSPWFTPQTMLRTNMLSLSQIKILYVLWTGSPAQPYQVELLIRHLLHLIRTVEIFRILLELLVRQSSILLQTLCTSSPKATKTVGLTHKGRSSVLTYLQNKLGRKELSMVCQCPSTDHPLQH